MASVYKVSFEKRYNGSEDWENDSTTVAAKDGKEAVAKVERSVLREKWLWKDDKGKEHKSWYTGFRWHEVHRISGIDVS